MKTIFLLLSSLVLTSCFNKKEAKVELKKSSPEIHKIAYSLGAQYGKSIEAVGLDKKAQELLVQGLVDYQSGKLKLTNNDIQHLAKRVDGILATKRAESAKSEKQKGVAFVDEILANDPEWKVTESGLLYKITKEGKRFINKNLNPWVEMHFDSFHLDGKQYESTEGGNPRLMPLNGIFKAWSEAFWITGQGGEVEIIAPSDLTYGDNGASPYIAPGEYLKFNLKFIKYYSKKP